MEPSHAEVDDPVVVIGFSFRFPQDAVSEEAFWKIILGGVSTMTKIPEDRYNVNGHYNPNSTRLDTVSSYGGHYVAGDISTFDAPFFNISGKEAQATDPQLRLLLETSYHALESAGLALEEVRGSATSVFVGNLVSEYKSILVHDEEINAKYEAIGTSMAMLSNRVSWFYDFRGPSISLDTACSSSLTCLHLAHQSLMQGESEMSFVCGVQLQLEPRSMAVPMSRLGVLSPDGHCHSFDERANGYSRGEGVGVLVLKRLSKALEHGDTIRAVLRGTSANQDGRTPSVSQPSPTAQAAVIRKAYEPLGMDFESTGYFEAHGTGTPVGDPIEARGIHMAFSECRSSKIPLIVGCVKANIGHLEATAGIAGVIKTILVLERGVIPPIALLANLNPAIRADEWHLEFPKAALVWPTEGLRRASVNSFGVGGTNSHVVIDDARYYLESRGIRAAHNTASRPDNDHISIQVSNDTTTNKNRPRSPDDGPFLFILSAADENGIQRLATTIGGYLEQVNRRDEVEYLQDLAFTLGSKRSMLAWKSFALGSSIDDLKQNLSTLSQKPVLALERPLLDFIFIGQGAQYALLWVNMVTHEEPMDILKNPWVTHDKFKNPWVNHGFFKISISNL